LNTGDQKVAVIGGCGHVGLPLGIVFANLGFQTTLIDINQDSVDLVNSGGMPFMEDGSDEALGAALKSGNLLASTDLSEISKHDILIVTIGTPVDDHQSPVPRVFLDFIDSIWSYLHSGQLIVLRSTVFPGTSNWVAEKLSKIGVDVAFCPERIVQGKALVELHTLPQIVSGSSPQAISRAEELFKTMSPQIVHASMREAEFAKLFLNAYRYIQFAVTNEFFMLTNDAGVDYEEVRRVMTEGYERAAGFPKAGLAAGPCLLKDTQQLLAFGQNNFHIGNSAILVNEGLALYLIEAASKLIKLENATVGILGMAFKANNDDIRASLSYRVRKMLQMRASKVLSSDPFVKNDSTLVTAEELMEDSDIIIICTPHDVYRDLDFRDKLIVDVWNTQGNGLVI
jgi:UDP-N-acetyl-D-mannosaminuronic acid dehydrogenase